jgi:heat shock protein HslJ
MKITPIKLMTAIVCLSFLAACQSPVGSSNAKMTDTVVNASLVAPMEPDSTTLGGSWVLQPVLPSDTAAGRTPTLQLDLARSRFSGNTGCNTMHGSFWYSKTDSSLSFSDKIVTTKMACPGYNEPAFIKSLQHTSHYRLRNGVLSLLADDNSALSRWTRKASAGPKVIKT